MGRLALKVTASTLKKCRNFSAKKVAYAEIFEVYLQNELKRLDADFGGRLL